MPSKKSDIQHGVNHFEVTGEVDLRGRKAGRHLRLIPKVVVSRCANQFAEECKARDLDPETTTFHQLVCIALNLDPETTTFHHRECAEVGLPPTASVHELLCAQLNVPSTTTDEELRRIRTQGITDGDPKVLPRFLQGVRHR